MTVEINAVKPKLVPIESLNSLAESTDRCFCQWVARDDCNFSKQAYLRAEAKLLEEIKRYSNSLGCN
jgi:hypothetical protein